MLAKRRWKGLLLGCLAFSSIVIGARGGSTPKQDRSWKRYYNSQWGYCVSYPSRWQKGDAFDGSGMFFETGVNRESNPLGEIDVNALLDRSANPHFNLVDTIQVHLDGLRKFERAEQVQLLEQRAMDLLGSSALFAKEQYYDPLEHAKWIEEIVFTARQNVLYRLELECRADQLTRFEPVFTHFVSTFQFDCAERR
jgi:hypothetical protein